LETLALSSVRIAKELGSFSLGLPQSQQFLRGSRPGLIDRLVHHPVMFADFTVRHPTTRWGRAPLAAPAIDALLNDDVCDLANQGGRTLRHRAPAGEL